MSVAKIDLEAICEQEKTLVFPYFNADIAWQIGSNLRDRASRENLPIAIEVSQAGRPLFFASMPGATPDNAE